MALKAFGRSTLAAVALAASALIAHAPASAAPSRAELEQRIIDLENEVARQRSQTSGLTGPIQQRLDSIQSELVRVVGELEEARFMNSRLQNELRSLRREIQLRDAEIAEALGLEPAFQMTDDPFAPPTATLAPGLLAQEEENAADADAGEPDPRGGVLTLPDGVDPNEAAGQSSSSSSSSPGFYDSQPFNPIDPDEIAAEVDEDGYLLPDDAAAALDAAKQYMLNGQFDVAESAFDEFGERFGGAPQEGEALFWRGELQFARSSFSDARDSYIASLRVDAAGPRAPDAMIQLAKSAHYMGSSDEACTVLSQFPQYYPNASATLRSKAESARQLASCR
ncbi:MAG: hypothetical protein PVI23_06780 [Maricaulaceae bacterium]|jgi:tol-pal system protein YbgF